MKTSTVLLMAARTTSMFVSAIPIIDKYNATMSLDSTAYDNIITTPHIEPRTAAMCENCMACTATGHGAIISYKVHIGADFANGGGCRPIKSSLDEAANVPPISG